MSGYLVRMLMKARGLTYKWRESEEWDVPSERAMGCKVINACQKWGKHGVVSCSEIRDKVTDLALKRAAKTRPYESLWQQGAHRWRHGSDRLKTRQQTCCCCFGFSLFCCVQGVDTGAGEQSFITEFLYIYVVSAIFL